MVFSLATVSRRPFRRAGCIGTGLLQFPCASQCECDTVRVGGREGVKDYGLSHAKKPDRHKKSSANI
ncbi:CiV19.5g5-like protein [Chelonus insularis]|nr:CiV19.5g5-like protein [Chelonus insularis]